MRGARFVRLAIGAALAVTVAAAMPAVGMGADGNSDAAAACRRGGWEQLMAAEDGSRFRNTGDCVSHAVKGGTIEPLRSLSLRMSGASGDFCEANILGLGYAPFVTIKFHVDAFDGSGLLIADGVTALKFAPGPDGVPITPFLVSIRNGSEFGLTEGFPYPGVVSFRQTVIC